MFARATFCRSVDTETLRLRSTATEYLHACSKDKLRSSLVSDPSWISYECTSLFPTFVIVGYVRS